MMESEKLDHDHLVDDASCMGMWLRGVASPVSYLVAT